MSVDANGIRENLERIRERVQRAAGRAGRRAEEITLVAVSKTFPADAIRDAFNAGLRHFGENRVQEWESKHPSLSNLDATWHLIGHLQSNKAARAAHLFHTVDSVDSLALAQKLDRALSVPEERSIPQRLRILIEVRLAPEETKSGASEAELPALAEGVLVLPRLELSGLMCIPPLLGDAGRTRPYFAKLREGRDSLAKRVGRALPVLSMGMSQDFEVAIEEGATEIRVGTALFGSRTANLA
jgi:pyridoxal phosphate enzyme (YggS family)